MEFIAGPTVGSLVTSCAMKQMSGPMDDAMKRTGHSEADVMCGSARCRRSSRGTTPSHERSRDRVDRPQPLTESGHRFTVSIQVTVCKVLHRQLLDAAEGWS